MAAGWDSGRLAFAEAGSLPFEHEVDALSARAGGRASERLQAAAVRAQALEAAAPLGDELSPLDTLAREHGLSRVATDILLVVAAPAIWGELARLYAIVANDAERPTCDEWLVAVLLGAGRAGRREVAAELEPSAPLVRSGLLQVGPGRSPFAALAVHPLVIRRLYGERFLGADRDPFVAPRDADRPLEELALAGDLAALWRSLCREPRTALRLCVRGATGSGRTTLLAALAARAGKRLGVIDLGALAKAERPLDQALSDALVRAELCGWLPCLSGSEQALAEDPAHQSRIAAVVRCHAGPLVLELGRDAVAPIDPGHLAFTLGPLDEAARARAWRRALTARGLPAHPAHPLAAKYRIGPATISRAAQQVAEAGLPEGADLVAQLDDALRQYRESRIGHDRRPRRAARDLVERRAAARGASTACASSSGACATAAPCSIAGASTGRDLDRPRPDRAVPGRPRHRQVDGRGRRSRASSATICTRSICRECCRSGSARPSATSAEVFDAAEDGQVMLAVRRGRRAVRASAPRSSRSNDRYANIEVNYLLQRLDSSRASRS